MCESNLLLFDYPNPRHNVFIMMRFQNTDQHHEILTSLRDTLAHYGINGLRADDKSYSESLWENVRSYMDACAYGICVFEGIQDEYFNPNVSLELGYMLAKNRPILLLKEKHLKELPSDVVGRFYRAFDSYNISTTIRGQTFEWLRDIGIAKSSAERLVLFVSLGGTCRCAMAKIALDQVLKDRQLPYRLRVISVAHAFGGTESASRGARRAVCEEYGSDFLLEHRVTRRNDGLLKDADLILVMEDNLREGLPPEKAHNFNAFFGLSGDVSNPWPDDGGEAAQLRYRKCMEHLRGTIECRYDRILKYLQ